MWRLEKSFRFEAAHRLPGHKGKCSRLHGHSWRVTLVLESASPPAKTGAMRGMVCDFETISKAMQPLLDDFLDHHYLNESLGLESPTCEAVAEWVYEKLRPWLNLLVAVIVEETCTSRCEYRP